MTGDVVRGQEVTRVGAVGGATTLAFVALDGRLKLVGVRQVLLAALILVEVFRVPEIE